MSFHLSALDNDELVHTAVREGHVISLEIYLNQNPNCINKLYIFNQAKWTPLIAACYYKHEHIVRMLLTRFKPNVDVVGTIHFLTLENNFELIEDVSSLWIAAAVNNFNIVKLLVEYGKANINQLTDTNSTALRAACYRNGFEMVKYLIEHGANPHQTRKGNYTNLMLCAHYDYSLIVKYLVTEIKCNINEQDKYGQTALYYAVRSGSIEITKFLLEHGALNICDNKRKVTPLLRAALFGDAALVDTFKGYCSDLQWIEAKELLATFFSGCIPNTENLNKTVEYLTETFELRLIKNLPKILTISSLEPLVCRRECETLEQFNKLISSNRKNALCIEAIFIHQRLLGDNHYDYHDIIHRYGSSLASAKQYHNCFRWWFYEFDLKLKYDITVEDTYTQSFQDIFTRMTFNEQLQISFDNLLQMFKIINHLLTSDKYKKHFDSNLIILLHLTMLVAEIIYSKNSEGRPELSIDHKRELHKTITLIIKKRYKTMLTGSSLLHLCSNSATENFTSDNDYPCSITACLLINCGADINEVDNEGNTPLHVLACQIPSSKVFKMIDLLCNSEAHLDYINKNKQIPLELVPSYRHTMIAYLNKKIDVCRLKCLCARIIRQQQFSIENIVSTSLLNFVQKH